jgi:hypothetical protein
MSQLFVDNIKNRTGGAVGFPTGVVVTGVITATTFKGNLTGGSVSGTTGSFSGNVSIGGTLTYEDVSNVDVVGVITAREGIRLGRVGFGATIGPAIGAGIVTYYGDGQYLQNIISGVTVQEEGSSLSNAATTLNFVGDSVTASGSGSTKTITISGGGGIQTTASSPSANTVVTLNLGTAQHHDLTLTAGITTITCTGGSFGESHSLVLTQPSSGIATVGFSTYFLFPSGATPSMSEGSSKVDLVSFVVRQQGSSGVATALLASAGLNYQ